MPSVVTRLRSVPSAKVRTVMHQSACCAMRLRYPGDTYGYDIGYTVQWRRRGRLGRASMEDPERHACWLGVQTGVLRVLSWRSDFLRRAQGERTPDLSRQIAARDRGAPYWKVDWRPIASASSPTRPRRTGRWRGCPSIMAP